LGDGVEVRVLAGDRPADAAHQLGVMVRRRAVIFDPSLVWRSATADTLCAMAPGIDAPDAPRVAIVDYGMGNLHSVKRKLDRIGVHGHLTSDPEEVLRADKRVLPGVGHFG